MLHMLKEDLKIESEMELPNIGKMKNIIWKK